MRRSARAAMAWLRISSRCLSYSPRSSTSASVIWFVRRSVCCMALLDRIESFLKPSGVRLFGTRERLEPVGDLAEALFARGACHAGVHVRVLVRLAVDRGLEVELRVADRKSGRGIADLSQIVEVAVRVAGLAFGRVAEE